MTKLLDGTVHKMPNDLAKLLAVNKKAVKLWEDITPLARNEWICWVENAKLIETRNRRIARVPKELVEGMRRPCCWIGCTHREDKAMSKTQKWLLDKAKDRRAI